jgi:hypothetical protein
MTMSDAIKATSAVQRAVDTARAKTRQALERDAVSKDSSVHAPNAPDTRGQLVDKEA